MELGHPISHYLKCIESLKQPYPVEYLRAFLGQYTSKFTRLTSPDLIFFDGKESVSIRSSSEKMTNQQIEAMLRGLIAYNGLKSAIVQRYNFAITQLIKRPGASPAKPKIRELTTFKHAPLFEVSQRWMINVSGNAKQAKEIYEFVKKVYTENRSVYGMVHQALDKCAQDDEECIWRTPGNCFKAKILVELVNLQDFLNQLHSSLTVKEAEKMLPEECSVVPAFMSSIPNLTGNGEKCLFSFAQGDPVQRKMLSKEEVDVLYDGDNYYKYFNTLDVGIDLQKYTQARLNVSTSEPSELKGIFTNFLFSITVDRADGLAMLSGQTKFFPIGSVFSYGIVSPQPDDGKMVFIMKPRFVKKYVSPEAMVKLGNNPAEMKLNHGVEIADPVSSVDVESVLVSKSLLSFAAIAEASSSRLVAGRINPFRNRVIFYAHTESPQLLPLKLYLSRCLYYGFFANSRFKFV